MIDNKKPYVICAAVHFLNREVYQEQPKNIELGFVVAGRRHNNAFQTAFLLYGEDEVQENVRKELWIPICGFITSDNRFVTRPEAAEIAFEAGQTVVDKQFLISEHLY